MNLLKSKIKLIFSEFQRKEEEFNTVFVTRYDRFSSDEIFYFQICLLLFS